MNSILQYGGMSCRSQYVDDHSWTVCGGLYRTTGKRCQQIHEAVRSATDGQLVHLGKCLESVQSRAEVYVL